MLITSIHHGLDPSHSYGVRGDGRHMSDLYGAYYEQLEPGRYGKSKDQSPPRERWGIGMAFEEMLEEGLAARVFNTNDKEEVIRPGELETHHTAQCKRSESKRTYGCGCWCGGGVLYNPDLFIFNGLTRVGEIKLNSMSAKGVPWKLGETYTGFDAKFDKFTCQMKLYCYHAKTPYGRLYSFSVREMVYFNEPGIFRAWDVDFLQHELDEEWSMMLHFGRQEKLLT